MEELLTQFKKIMQKLNISINYFENTEEMNYEDKNKFDYICRQYLFLFK
jgi:hypothetical protein